MAEILSIRRKQLSNQSIITRKQIESLATTVGNERGHPFFQINVVC